MRAYAPRLRAMAQKLEEARPPAPAARAETFSVMIPGITGEADYRSQDFFLIIEMPLESVALRSAFIAELTGLYSFSGENGIAALEAGVRLVAAMGTQPDVPNKLAFEHGFRVMADFEHSLREFRETLEATRQTLESAAVRCAIADLELASGEILDEAARYFAMAPRNRETAKTLLESGAPAAHILLRGPGVVDIAKASLRMHRAIRTGAPQPAANGSSGRPSGIMDFVLPPATADNSLEVSLTALMQLVTLRCKQHPLLHRIWRNHPLDSHVRILETGLGEYALAGETRAASLALQQFTAAAYSVLRDSHAANKKFAAGLAGDASLVWLFAPLLGRVLDTDEFADEPLARQVAAKGLQSAEGMSKLAKASLVASGAEIAAGAAAAAPPVLTVLAVTIAVLSVVDLTNEFQINRAREAAANAVLDPSRSAAEEPGMFGLMIAVAFSLLDLKSVRDAVRAARVASELAVAQRSVELVAP